jgi:hypothetical protein
MAGAMRVTGLSEAISALRAMAVRVEEATPIAVTAAAELVENQAKANLSRYSHARGTPTPSPRGEPPAMIDGTLRDNWEKSPPVPTGTGGWVCTLRPTTVYAGIQEFGGKAGRGGASVLPERPYLRPAVEEMVRSGAIEAAFAHAWGAAIAGG